MSWLGQARPHRRRWCAGREFDEQVASGGGVGFGFAVSGFGSLPFPDTRLLHPLTLASRSLAQSLCGRRSRHRAPCLLRCEPLPSASWVSVLCSAKSAWRSVGSSSPFDGRLSPGIVQGAYRRLDRSNTDSFTMRAINAHGQPDYRRCNGTGAPDRCNPNPIAGWVVMRDLPDYPDKIIARLVTDRPTPYVLMAESLAELQAQLPSGLVRVERQPADLPEVVEIWFPA
jgi:hypothetical protein